MSSKEEIDSLQAVLAKEKEKSIELTDQEYALLRDSREIATPEQKMAAVMEWYLTGSNTKAAKATGNPEVSHQLVYRWRKAGWWNKLLEKCRSIRSEELERLATSSYHTALFKLQHTLEHGDQKFDPKSGELVNVPVPAKDLAFIAKTLQEQRAHLLLKDDGTQDTPTSQLSRIADKLVATINQANKNPSGVTISNTTPEKDITTVN